jgi:hypothetical protein
MGLGLIGSAGERWKLVSAQARAFSVELQELGLPVLPEAPLQGNDVQQR